MSRTMCFTSQPLVVELRRPASRATPGCVGAAPCVPKSSSVRTIAAGRRTASRAGSRRPARQRIVGRDEPAWPDRAGWDAGLARFEVRQEMPGRRGDDLARRPASCPAAARAITARLGLAISSMTIGRHGVSVFGRHLLLPLARLGESTARAPGGSRPAARLFCGIGSAVLVRGEDLRAHLIRLPSSAGPAGTAHRRGTCRSSCMAVGFWTRA